MARITKDILAQIEAHYTDVGHRAHWHKYNAAARIDIKVGGRGWLLYVSPSRVDRPIDEAIKKIIRETKVGKQIFKKAARHAKIAKAEARERKATKPALARAA